MKNRTWNAFGAFANKHFCVCERWFWIEKKSHSKTEKDFCKPFHLVLVSSKQPITIVFHWWKRQCDPFSEVKKVTTDLLFAIDFVCFLLNQTCESSCFHRRATVFKTSSRAIFTAPESWSDCFPTVLGPLSKDVSHWSERWKRTSEPSCVRHSTLSFCQTFSSTPVALADI